MELAESLNSKKFSDKFKTHHGISALRSVVVSVKVEPQEDLRTVIALWVQRLDALPDPVNGTVWPGSLR